MSRALVAAGSALVLEGGSLAVLAWFERHHEPFDGTRSLAWSGLVASVLLGLFACALGLRELAASRRARGRAGPGLTAMAIGGCTAILSLTWLVTFAGTW